MFAVIESGGKQYRVEQGDVIDVETGPESDDGQVVFDRVLMVGEGSSVQVGNPTVDGAQVAGELVGELRGPKIKVFKKKRRKGYKRTQGHRQDVLRIRINEISGS